jgi:DNA-binding PadR family transcriptional regulator
MTQKPGKYFEVELGTFEILVLLTLLRLHEGSGRQIHEALEASGVNAREATVRITVARLERKKDLFSRMTDRRPMRGGKRQRIFSVSDSGIEKLHRMLGAIKNITQDIRAIF